MHMLECQYSQGSHDHFQTIILPSASKHLAPLRLTLPNDGDTIIPTSPAVTVSLLLTFPMLNATKAYGEVSLSNWRFVIITEDLSISLQGPSNAESH